MEDLMLREILKDCGGDGAIKKLAQRKLDSTGYVNAFCNSANSLKRIARLKAAAQLAASMADIYRAQHEESSKKKADEEDLLVAAAPAATIKLQSNSLAELGPAAWFKKLTVKELRAISYEYYKVNTPVMLKSKVVEALCVLYEKNPDRLPPVEATS